MAQTTSWMSRLVGACVLTVAVASVGAQPPSGTIAFKSKEFALGIGGTQGTGKLEFKGKSYHIKMKSLDIVSVGWSKADVKGTVYNLANVEDFPGKYKSLEANVTIGTSGGSNAVLKSDSGVEIHLQSTGEKGFQVQAGGSGIEFTLE